MITLPKNITAFYLFSFLLILTSCQPPNQANDNKDDPSNGASAPFVDVDVATFKSKMTEDNIVVLDVRTPEETAEGIIEGAIEIDYRSPDFAQKISALDKNKTYLVYCRSGGRSVNACNEMTDQGFDNLYNLLGGYMAWSKQH